MMTNKSDIKLVDLEWFPREYAETLDKYGIRTIYEFYRSYLGLEYGRRPVEKLLRVEEETLAPLIKQVETCLFAMRLKEKKLLELEREQEREQSLIDLVGLS